jgi:hypothetical protein
VSSAPGLCPAMGSGCWPGGGCWARAPRRCSRRVPGIRWSGRCWRCPRWRPPGCWRRPRQVYGRLRDGFYGLAATLLTVVFLALAGEPRAEDATRIPPAALGRVLGLDRAPEVKTIRRKLAELAAAGTRPRKRGLPRGRIAVGPVLVTGAARSARLAFPWTMLRCWWQAWSKGAPPPQLQALVNSVAAGCGLHLYIPKLNKLPLAAAHREPVGRRRQ